MSPLSQKVEAMLKYAVIRSYTDLSPVCHMFFSTPSEAWITALEWRKDTGLRPTLPSTWNILAFDGQERRNLTDAEWESIENIETAELHVMKDQPKLKDDVEAPIYTGAFIL